MTKTRIAYWDTIKGGLIFLVVLGHMLYTFQSDHKSIHMLVDAIYMFHMPAFVFVSGFFSKSEHSRSLESIMKLAAAYVLIDGSLLLLDAGFHHNMNYIVPYYHCWYLLALIVWRLTVDKVAKIRFVLPLSVIVAILVGFCPEIDNTMAISRIIAFYPFFLAGYFLQHEQVQRMLAVPQKWRLIKGLSAGLFAAVLAAVAYKIFHYTDTALLMFPYEAVRDSMGRLAVFVVATAMIYCMLQIAPPPKTGSAFDAWR